MRLLIATIVTALVLALSPAAASADPPLRVPIDNTIPAVNPCTGQAHLITFSGTLAIHPNHVHATTTTTTSDGWVGHGALTMVENGQVMTNTFNDNLQGPNGQHVKVHAVFIFDVSEGVFRVEMPASPTCYGNGAN